MESIPLQDMLQGTPWKAPFDNAIFKRDNNLIAAIFRMKMWGTVLAVVTNGVSFMSHNKSTA